MYSQNPNYFSNPQHFHGVQRVGPRPAGSPMGFLSINGQIYPAPSTARQLAGIAYHGYDAEGKFDGEGMDWKLYAKWGGIGIAVGGLVYAGYHFFMKGR